MPPVLLIVVAEADGTWILKNPIGMRVGTIDADVSRTWSTEWPEPTSAAPYRDAQQATLDLTRVSFSPNTDEIDLPGDYLVFDRETKMQTHVFPAGATLEVVGAVEGGTIVPRAGQPLVLADPALAPRARWAKELSVDIGIMRRTVGPGLLLFAGLVVGLLVWCYL